MIDWVHHWVEMGRLFLSSLPGLPLCVGWGWVGRVCMAGEVGAMRVALFRLERPQGPFGRERKEGRQKGRKCPYTLLYLYLPVTRRIYRN